MSRLYNTAKRMVKEAYYTHKVGKILMNNAKPKMKRRKTDKKT